MRFFWIILSLSLVQSLHAQSITTEVGVALVSDYRFRGLTQTDHHPVIQGNLSLHWKQLTVGVWGSPVNFRDGGQATAEVDLFAGFAPVRGFEIGGVAYLYPGSPSALGYNFLEIYTTLEQGPFSASLYASPEFFGRTGPALYGETGLSISLPVGLHLGLTGGYQYVRRSDDYFQTTLAIGGSLLGLSLQVVYVYPTLKEASDGFLFSIAY